MCLFKTLGVSWPPKGWKEFFEIEASHGQSILKDPVSACVTGLSYHIDPIPTYHKNNDRKFVYAVCIEGWDYNIYNESREYPVLSFVLHERPEENTSKYLYMSDIRTQGRSVKITERSAYRAFMAALFLMKQINSGQVSEAERILRLYKIHPTQRSLYDADNQRQNSLFCRQVNKPNQYQKIFKD
ncbi:MAG: hypothetical protein R3D88_04055 [Alphaproteobacteria bacterium]|nr:hypothetical protein [Alphaproteobacteria bacterium]